MPNAVAVLDAVGALAAADTASAVILADNALIEAVEKFFVNDAGDFADLNETLASENDAVPVVALIDYTGDGDGDDMNVILGIRGTDVQLDNDGLVGALRIAVIERIAAEVTAETAITANITALIVARAAVDGRRRSVRRPSRPNRD